MFRQRMGNDFKNFLFSKSLLSRIVIINIIIWILILLSNLFTTALQPGVWNLKNWLFDFFGLHSDIHILLKMPWTLFSYMFLHANFWPLLFNVLMLYFGGILFSQYLGQKRFAYTYFLGGLAGALVFIAACNLFPDLNQGVIVGASAAVLSVFFGIAAYIPNYEVNLFLFGRLKLKHLILIFVGIDLFNIFYLGVKGEYLAHFGGALYGFLSIWLPRYFKNQSTPKRKFKVTRSAEAAQQKKGRPLTDEEYNRIRAEKQKEIDAILDKISKYGYESLTKKEKEALFDSGNKN